MTTPEPLHASRSRSPLARAAALALALFAAACEAGEGPVDSGRRDASADAPRDGGPGDMDAGCAPDRTYCQGGGAYECNAAGQRINERACTGATPECVPGTGCAACAPGRRRCDPGAADTPQTCAPDGSSWVSGAACAGGLDCAEGSCVDPCAGASSERSYIGCEYWPVTTFNAGLATGIDGSLPFAIAIANTRPRAVTATIDGGALSTPRAVTIAANSLETVELPWVPALSNLGDLGAASALERLGAYHVRATSPVTVYQFNPLSFVNAAGTPSYSNDASLLLPTGALSGRHIVLGYGAFGPSSGGFTAGFVAVVGTREGSPTQVNVTASVAIRAGNGVPAMAAGERRTFALNRGDVLQLIAQNNPEDLTGTALDSDAPVAVFSGHGCANVPINEIACDHLEEQLFPLDAWGVRYAVTPFVDRPDRPSLVRVLAQRDGTMVTFEPAGAHAPVTLDAGRVLDMAITFPIVVSASAPVLVGQYMYGQGEGEGGAGDPAMVFEVPVEQYRTSYTFLVPATYTRNFVNIVGPTGSAPLLDGAPLTAAPAAIGASGLSHWSFELPAGTHQLGSADGMVQFGVKVYGVASYTSYAYPGGLDLRVINPPPG